MYFINNLLTFVPENIYLLIPIMVVFIVLLISSIYDLKFGIVPNILSKLLIVFGFIFNLSIAVIYSNYLFLSDCLIISLIVLFISVILWKIKFWGGGDVKIIVGMALSLSYLSSSSLPLCSSPPLNFMPFIHQNIFYYPIFSILFNAILISFPFLVILMFVIFYKDNKNLIKEMLLKDLSYSKTIILKVVLYLESIKFFIFNFINIMKVSSEKTLQISDLKEGMIINKYFFSTEDEKELISDYLKFIFFSEIDDKNINLNYGNMDVKIYEEKITEEDRNKFEEIYEEKISEEDKNKLEDFDTILTGLDKNFKANNDVENSIRDFFNSLKEKNIRFIESSNGMGLTKEDISIINFLFEKGHFKNPEFTIKRSIAFIPPLTIGYIIFIIYGDLIYLISNFLSNLF